MREKTKRRIAALLLAAGLIAANLFSEQHSVPEVGGSNSARYFKSVDPVVMTDENAAGFVQIQALPGTITGGVLYYTVRVSNATDVQARTGLANLALVNDAGTITCTLTADAGGSVVAVSSGTLTTTVACDTALDPTVELTVTPSTSLSSTTIRGEWQLMLNGTVTIAPQQ